MTDGNCSPQEIEWLIEDRKRRLEDLEEQIRSTSDPDVLRGLKGMAATIQDELADFERRLDEAGDVDRTEDQMADIDSKIRDIDSALSMESDPIVRNNLEVSKRYLQMERNGLLIRKTQVTERKDPRDARLEELEELCESRLRLISDLRDRLAKAEKDLSYYRALSENPERDVSCDRTRVSVTAEELSKIRNESKVLSVDNYRLKKENRDLKSEMDLQRKNVMDLTRHCRDADSQILILESRIQKLMRESEGRE